MFRTGNSYLPLAVLRRLYIPVLLLLSGTAAWPQDLASLDAREAELRARLEQLAQERVELESQLLAIEKERAALVLGSDGALRLEHSGLCIRERNTISAEEPCTLGPAGVYSVLKYDPDTSLAMVSAPDGRVGFAGVAPFEFQDPEARRRYESMVSEKARRLAEEERVRRQEAQELWEANRRAEQAEEAAARKAAAAKREKDLRAKYGTSRFTDAIVARKVSLGMSPEMVRDSWGKPDDINRTITPGLVREQWVYGLENFVYFECQAGSCEVTAIQN